MTEQELLDRGFYKRPYPKYQYSDAIYEKRYDEGKKIKYFLEVIHFYIPDGMPSSSWQIKTQMRAKGTHHPFNVTFLHGNVDEAEKALDEMIKDGIAEYWSE